MKDNPYQLAGIMAIMYAIIFPLAFVIGFLQQLIISVKLHSTMPNIGPADGLMIIGTIMMVYVMLRFKDMLNNHYSYKRIDRLIVISVWWMIVFQICAVAVKGLLLWMHPVDKFTVFYIKIPLMVIALLTIGIVDLMIAVRLLKDREQLSELMQVFAYMSLVAGISEVTVILSPIAIILVPVSSVVLGMIFLREKEEMEFV